MSKGIYALSTRIDRIDLLHFGNTSFESDSSDQARKARELEQKDLEVWAVSGGRNWKTR